MALGEVGVALWVVSCRTGRTTVFMFCFHATCMVCLRIFSNTQLDPRLVWEDNGSCVACAELSPGVLHAALKSS